MNAANFRLCRERMPAPPCRRSGAGRLLFHGTRQPDDWATQDEGQLPGSISDGVCLELIEFGADEPLIVAQLGRSDIAHRRDDMLALRHYEGNGGRVGMSRFGVWTAD